MEAKYPKGSKIKITSDKERIIKESPQFNILWIEEKSEILGQEVEVVSSYRNRPNDPIFYVVRLYSERWTIVEDWVVDNWIDSASEDDPDQLLKKQRDEILAAIFGG